ncbi:M18 family aminopeptidase [uncultured Megasphaera sp.]|uniref:M18 family aminopeptidase n=1 Tax=uncultured Megasphaera sp. TaxID=165188 RepID=UPI00265A6E8B|nr:M18 family aminopeptidase [uncultured Megasphaera sp.]
MTTAAATPRQLLNFIHRSPSPYHVVQTSMDLLKEAGFTELSPHAPWELHEGGSYVVTAFDSSLLAFTIGRHPRAHLRIAAAHTDFPCLRVKPAASIMQGVYGKLNIELYGGMIRESWLDRPLSLAGKIATTGTDPFHPAIHVVDFHTPLLTIPRLAIHMNRHTNDGVALNPQKDMLPLMTLCDGSTADSFLLDYLAEYCHCAVQDILSYDLTVYPAEEGCLLGLHNEFISSPRLDNLTSVYASIAGLANHTAADGIQAVALFDNEEVGSRTKQGAASLLLPTYLQRLYHALGYTDEDYRLDQSSAFVLSIDVAHAMHPNMPEKCDITNIPVLGHGIALKTACSQAYAGDAEAAAIITALCRSGNIPYQHFVNRSDIPGGSTLGSLLSSYFPVRTMDIGIPILAMHSARELMGAADLKALYDLIGLFFTE